MASNAINDPSQLRVAIQAPGGTRGDLIATVLRGLGIVMHDLFCAADDLIAAHRQRPFHLVVLDVSQSGANLSSMDTLLEPTGLGNDPPCAVLILIGTERPPGIPERSNVFLIAAPLTPGVVWTSLTKIFPIADTPHGAFGTAGWTKALHPGGVAEAPDLRVDQRAPTDWADLVSRYPDHLARDVEALRASSRHLSQPDLRPSAWEAFVSARP